MLPLFLVWNFGWNIFAKLSSMVYCEWFLSSKCSFSSFNCFSLLLVTILTIYFTNYSHMLFFVCDGWQLMLLNNWRTSKTRLFSAIGILISRKFRDLEGFSKINFKSESRLLMMLWKISMSKLSNHLWNTSPKNQK